MNTSDEIAPELDPFPLSIRRMSASVFMVAVFLVCQPVCAGEADNKSPSAAENGTIDFTRDVQPIFAKACYGCHGPKRQRSSFRLDQKKSALNGGDLGPAILPGNSHESPLIRYVSDPDADLIMPPEGKRLTPAQVGVLRAWIDQGAEWPDSASAAQTDETWWSLRPLSTVAPPLTGNADALNPIDAFILAKLKEMNLSPSPEADRRTLIRRLYFDLIGLPPTPEAVDAFLRDESPTAYEDLVDRLLASPQYGERWARHWLDVVHYGETHGYDKDKPRPNAWPYRDYVIRAFNDDKPYGRFVQEQIAGDVLFPRSADGIEALGFIAAGPWDLIGHEEVPETRIDGKITRHLDRDDMVANAMGTFASMTASCAQCHDHKFDPITMEDYYSLQAVFAALDRADRRYDADPQVSKQRDALERRARELAAAANELQSRVKNIGGSQLAELDAQIDAAGKQSRAPADRLSELQQQREQLLAKVVDSQLQAELASNSQELSAVREAISKLPPPKLVYSGTVYQGTGSFLGTGHIGGRPRPIHVLTRGDVKKPGAEVGPGALGAVKELSARFDLPAGHTEGDRRAALARWLTDPKNPLTWRSIVNRVWHYHFGRGLVDSPNDFGRMGQLPSHPELLDWLAIEFRDGGQSLKKLHRLIVTSVTYRQSSADRAEAAKFDSSNQYYWRMNRRQLEAEAIRDSILSVSGKLDLRMGGPSFQDFVIERPEHSPHYKYELHDPEDVKSHRRSVYRFIVRSQQQPFMAALDCADPSLAVEKRNQTITPQQALALLNNQLSLAMARHFAARVRGLETDLEKQAARAFLLALGRSPAPLELETLTQYAQEHGLANMCRVILNLNEFMFVD